MSLTAMTGWKWVI